MIFMTRFRLHHRRGDALGEGRRKQKAVAIESVEIGSRARRDEAR
jgi:hypothetical protein